MFLEIEGNIGKDPETRFTPTNNKKVVTFSIATSRKDPKKEGEFITEWVNVVAYGDQADIAEQQVRKGMRMVLWGSFQKRTYQNKEGNQVDVWELWLNKCAQVFTKVKAEDTGSTIPDDDLPF